MVSVNGKDLEWSSDLTFTDVYRRIGYTISNPRVIVRVNGKSVPKHERPGYKIPDSADIEVVNTLCGG